MFKKMGDWERTSLWRNRGRKRKPLHHPSHITLGLRHLQRKNPHLSVPFVMRTHTTVTSVPSLLKLLSKEELLKILQKKSMCKTCLHPLGPNHNKAFCEKSYNKKLKRYFWNACICKSGLHRLLCCRKPKPDSDGTLPPATSTGRIQAEILEVNSCPIGQSLSQSEILTIVGPRNDKISCVVLYDNQANKCHLLRERSADCLILVCT